MRRFLIRTIFIAGPSLVAAGVAGVVFQSPEVAGVAAFIFALIGAEATEPKPDRGEGDDDGF